MKDINNYILEKLKIDKDTKILSDELNFSDYKSVVNYIQELAKEKNLEVKFRNRKINYGDFCFFIYDKSVKSSYLVGYDGYWSSRKDSFTGFEYCAKSTIKFIEDYTK